MNIHTCTQVQTTLATPNANQISTQWSTGNMLRHGSCGSGFDSVTTLGTLSTHVPLSQNSTVWYQSKLERKWQVLLYTGQISNTLGFVHCQLKSQLKEISTSPMILMEYGAFFLLTMTTCFQEFEVKFNQILDSLQSLLTSNNCLCNLILNCV